MVFLIACTCKAMQLRKGASNHKKKLLTTCINDIFIVASMHLHKTSILFALLLQVGVWVPWGRGTSTDEGRFLTLSDCLWPRASLAPLSRRNSWTATPPPGCGVKPTASMRRWTLRLGHPLSNHCPPLPLRCLRARPKPWGDQLSLWCLPIKSHCFHSTSES